MSVKELYNACRDGKIEEVKRLQVGRVSIYEGYTDYVNRLVILDTNCNLTFFQFSHSPLPCLLPCELFSKTKTEWSGK